MIQVSTFEMTVHNDRLITSSALIGRTVQFDTLLQLYEQAVSRQGQVALITGEAGIGKTRLIREFLMRLPASTIVLQGCCFEQDQALP